MKTAITWVAMAALAAGCATQATLDGAKLRVVSDTTVSGFVFPESIGCDATEKVLYVGSFGGTELKPGEKDGNGYISKVGLDGKVIDARWVPASGETLHKPKGIWVQGNRLWVPDIDVVWIYDTKTRKGRKLEIPGAKFANDVAIMDGALYVSDNRADLLFRVEPADFLDASVRPKVTTVFSGKAVNPNGIYPSPGGLLLAGFLSADTPRALFTLGRDGEPRALSNAIGRLDGLYRMADGTILATDWNSGSLFRWTAAGGVEHLAKNFKGPADFCVMAHADGLTVYVPDLVQSHIRIVRLAP